MLKNFVKYVFSFERYLDKSVFFTHNKETLKKLLVTEGIIVHVQKTIFKTFKNYQRKEQPTVLSIFLNEKFMVNIQNIQQRGK